jgi:hypothetical protein
MQKLRNVRPIPTITKFPQLHVLDVKQQSIETFFNSLGEDTCRRSDMPFPIHIHFVCFVQETLLKRFNSKINS